MARIFADDFFSAGHRDIFCGMPVALLMFWCYAPLMQWDFNFYKYCAALPLLIEASLYSGCHIGGTGRSCF